MSLIEWYIGKLKNVHAIHEINEIIEIAANDYRLTTEEYQVIYMTGIRMIMCDNSDA